MAYGSSPMGVGFRCERMDAWRHAMSASQIFDGKPDERQRLPHRIFNSPAVCTIHDFKPREQKNGMRKRSSGYAKKEDERGLSNPTVGSTPSQPAMLAANGV
ncbi:hypothetical protein N7486_002262 [Penicillium sp. IBT 16267x]|nr:hypothetical protein N7486_002262 [Penicillium sp. IBT 16267x]